ncbi:MAG TPA: autotransporter assembly complex family protein [Acetobacteraceae bacterium]
MPSVRAAVPLFAILIAVSAARPAHAADPQPYAVTLKPTGNGALDGALHDSASLISLQKTAPVGGFALVERARRDAGRFETALRSYGYYKGRVSVTIGGHPLDDPTLPDTIERASADPPMPVIASFDLGPQFQFGKVVVDGTVSPEARAKLEIAPGQPALAEAALAAQSRLLEAVREDGYPLAKVNLPPAVLHPDQNKLDLDFQVESGPRADIGPIQFTGLKAMSEAFLRRRLLLHQGELFRPSAIEKARQDLASIGVFSVVRAEPAQRLDAQGELPVDFDVTERSLHAVDLGAAYSTDLGVNLSAGWHDRNLFGNAEQLNFTGLIQLGGNAVTKPGYQLGAQFVKPDFLVRDQSLELGLNALKQSLQAYDQTALIERAAINRKLSPHWTGSLGIYGEQERITQEGQTQNFNLIGIPISAKYDSTNSLLDPTQGIRATLSVTPTYSIGPPGATFFIMQAAGSTYLDLAGNGRSVLALRGLVGQASGVGVFGLPPDQRFYAGGSGTVRGYRYQSIGPQFADNRPTGGTAVSAGTVEFRQRILGSYGVVGFVDVGQVSANGAPFTSNWHAGAGVGFRYYTSIGPIRLDVAVPLNKQPGGDSLELYIGIGQAF